MMMMKFVTSVWVALLTVAPMVSASPCLGTHKGTIFYQADSYQGETPPCHIDGNVYVSARTTGALHMPGIKSISGYLLGQAEKMTGFNAPDLEKVTQEIFFNDNLLLKAVDFPNLKSTQGIYMKGNPEFNLDLAKVFPKLEHLGKMSGVESSIVYFDNGKHATIGRFAVLQKVLGPVMLKLTEGYPATKTGSSCPSGLHDRYRFDYKYNRRFLTQCSTSSKSASAWNEKTSGETLNLEPDQIESTVAELTLASVEQYETAMKTAMATSTSTQTSFASSSFSSSSSLVLLGSVLAILANVFFMSG